MELGFRPHQQQQRLGVLSVRWVPIWQPYLLSWRNHRPFRGREDRRRERDEATTSRSNTVPSPPPPTVLSPTAPPLLLNRRLPLLRSSPRETQPRPLRRQCSVVASPSVVIVPTTPHTCPHHTAPSHRLLPPPLHRHCRPYFRPRRPRHSR
jgi:hypothetical protein